MPTLNELVTVADFAYTGQQIMLQASARARRSRAARPLSDGVSRAQELHVLKILDFALHLVTPLDYLEVCAHARGG